MHWLCRVGGVRSCLFSVSLRSGLCFRGRLWAILTAGAPNSRLRVLSGSHCAAFEHDEAEHILGEILPADLGGGAQCRPGCYTKSLGL